MTGVVPAHAIRRGIDPPFGRGNERPARRQEAIDRGRRQADAGHRAATAPFPRLELHAVEWIRGVRVTGTLRQSGAGTLTVSGHSAAAGTLTFTRNGVTGTLGGQPISVKA